jgi:hemoglobin
MPELPADVLPSGAPSVRADLSTRADVHDLVVEFYREVVFDEVLEPLFGEVAEVDWALHIPKLVDYWCRILLGEHDYAGPVMAVHRHLHSLEPITPEHCDRWYGLWARCVESRWAGPTAAHATSHARSLMAGMAKHVFGFTWSPPAC